jgi:hypothetical protein
MWRKHANPSTVPTAEHNLKDGGADDLRVPWNIAAHTANRLPHHCFTPLSRCDQKPPQ